MVFSSTLFLFLFFPIVLGTYFVVPKSARNYHLLLFSLFFYAWSEPIFLFIMLFSISVNYALGTLLMRYDGHDQARKRIVAFAVLFNIGLLILYKYSNFLVDNANILLSLLGRPPLIIGKILLPIGISFFTFHALSYVIDIYRRKCPVQKNWGVLALYFAFFPQLIAGPIIRYSQVAKQFSNRRITADSFGYGARRFIFGLAKKVLIANNMAVVADKIFALPATGLTFGASWLGIVAYTLQIYFDFSGYSDMAIGLARMFGFRFLENFKYPYVSRSIREFWTRWHISLSTWFRDYLYIPLGGNRGGALNNYRNLLIVFLLCGFWHGASWTFVLWGAYYGFFLVMERMFGDALLTRLWKPVQHGYALFVIMIGWVLFRADTPGHALAYIQCMFGLTRPAAGSVPPGSYLNGQIVFFMTAAVLLSAPTYWYIVRNTRRWINRMKAFPKKALEFAYAGCYLSLELAMLLLSFAALASGTHNPFIYFRF